MKAFYRLSMVLVPVLIIFAVASWNRTAPARAGNTDQPGAGAAAGTIKLSNATGETTSDALVGELEIHSFEMGFKPATINVDMPGRYTIKLVNDGVIPHDITFPDGTRIVANGDETKTSDFVVPAEGTAYICSVPGHAASGMKGTITVGATAAETHGGGNAGGDHGGPPPATDVQPDPNAPSYTAFDATAPKALEGTTHDIDLVIEEKEMTVADGFVQNVWTFGGTVPGPVIRVTVGDTVRVHLKNPATNHPLAEEKCNHR